MQFSVTTGQKNGVIQECERYTPLGDAGISGVPALLLDFTNYSNRILRRVWHIIFMADNGWQYDDSNQTDLPQATANLTSGTATYALPSSALTVRRLEAKDSNGIWKELNPIILENINGGINEYEKNDGVPNTYRLLGSTIELFPAPSYNSTSGLKVYFDRGSVSFLSTDTTISPGFVSEYHDAIPLGASIEWYKKFKPTDPTLAKYEATLGAASFEVYPGIAPGSGLLGAIENFYSSRFKNRSPKLTTYTVNWR